jgi:hypothetical protein
MVDADGRIYAAALDTLVADRESLWVQGATGPFRILDTIYWWPMVQVGGGRGAGLGPISAPLTQMARQLGREVSLVGSDSAINPEGTLSPGGPVIAFGPIDYLARDEVVLRAAIYAGRNGQELYRVLLRRDGAVWRAVALQIELQS